MTLLLYLAATALVLAASNRWLQRVPPACALVLIALPMLVTGRALIPGRTAAPADLSFGAEPLRDYARDFGVETPHEPLLSDLHCQILPWQRAVRDALARGEWPLWNPSILCGDILAAAAQPAVYDPLQLLSFVLPLPDGFTFLVTMTFFLAALFGWSFARELELHAVASLVAAAGYSMCGMLAFFAGWPLGRSWAYLPLVLLATRRVVLAADGEPPGAAGRIALLCLSLVLTIFAGHPESVLHIVAVGIAYGLFELARARRVRPVVHALAAGVLALLLTAVYLLPFLEAVPQTLEHEIRDQLYKHERYDRLAPPEVRAERMRRTFLPNHPLGKDPLSARTGLPILLLALAGIALNARRAETWFFTALGVVGLRATFGTWPVAHALHAMPLFDIAINERLAFAAAFAMSILAAMAVARMNRNAAIVVLMLVVFQRAWEDGGHYPALNRAAFYPRVPLLAQLPHDARVAGLFFAFTPNLAAMYGLEDARGYEAMTNKRLTETYPLWSKFQTAWFNRIDDLSRPFLSFLNVRYAIAKSDAPEGWRVVAEDRGTRILENMRVLPRAFLPRRIRYERDGRTILAQMQQATDFADVAWIEAPEFEPHEASNGTGSVALHRSGNAYLLDVELARPAWIVISATHWKGWRAAIDGRRVTPRFANHAFLGVYVPEGAHRVQLRYRPDSFVRGRAISIGTLALLAIAAVCYKARRGWLRSFSISPFRSR